ncbi:MAG: hypothetical protein J6J31_01005 [Thermoguttaceae bacterium]|nr:hypothetical protein [Thermoguttaceae bacterium]
MSTRPEKKCRILTPFCVYWLIYICVFAGFWQWTSNFRALHSLHCSDDGKYALAWTHSDPLGENLNLWDTRTGEYLGKTSHSLSAIMYQPYSRFIFRGEPVCVQDHRPNEIQNRRVTRWTPDRKFRVDYSRGRAEILPRLQVLDVLTRESKIDFELEKCFDVSAAAVSRGQRIAYAYFSTKDSQAKLWIRSFGEEAVPHYFPIAERGLYCMAWSPDERFLVLGGNELLILFDTLAEWTWEDRKTELREMFRGELEAEWGLTSGEGLSEDARIQEVEKCVSAALPSEEIMAETRPLKVVWETRRETSRPPLSENGKNGIPAGETESGETQSEGSQSEGSQSEGSQSDGSQSDGSQSDGSQSDGSQSEGSKIVWPSNLYISSLQWLPDGSGIVAQMQSDLGTFDAKTGELLRMLKIPSSVGEPGKEFQFSSDMRYSAGLEWNGKEGKSVLAVREVETGRLAAEFHKPFFGRVKEFCWSPDGRMLVILLTTGQIRTLRMPDGPDVAPDLKGSH